MRWKFWKKKKEEVSAEIPPVPKEPPTPETAGRENLKAKMDLIMTQMDSLRVQNETLNERIKNIEKGVAEILEIAKSEATQSA